jgi:TfoX/Sxy family transcriptional regulator of competence genes
MAYDQDLAERIREALAAETGVREKRMFGGLAFLLGGHMTAAASRDGGMMLRIDPEHADDLVAVDGVSRMVMNGREMDGWLRVAEPVIATDEALRTWLAHGVTFVKAMPPRSA